MQPIEVKVLINDQPIENFLLRLQLIDSLSADDKELAQKLLVKIEAAREFAKQFEDIDVYGLVKNDPNGARKLLEE